MPLLPCGGVWGLSKVPQTCKPATSDQMRDLLEKAHKKGCLNLVVALSQEAVTAISLLKKPHISTSLRHSKIQTPAKAAGKLMWKLHFCPFCQYCSSNDPSYLNHIICVHYKASFGCGHCLGEVYSIGQALSKHMRGCKGLKATTTKGKSSPSPTKGASKSPCTKKKHHHHMKSQHSSQVSSHSPPHCSKCTKKKPHSHSGGKDSGAKHSSSKHDKKDDNLDKKKMHKHTKQKK